MTVTYFKIEGKRLQMWYIWWLRDLALICVNLEIPYWSRLSY